MTTRRRGRHNPERIVRNWHGASTLKPMSGSNIVRRADDDPNRLWGKSPQATSACWWPTYCRASSRHWMRQRIRRRYGRSFQAAASTREKRRACLKNPRFANENHPQILLKTLFLCQNVPLAIMVLP